LASGIILGLCLVGSLAATPIAITATIFASIIICNNVLAALFSRLGRLIDGIKRVSTTQEERKVDFYKKELLQTEFSFIDANCWISKRTSSLLSLPLSISYSAKDTDLEDGQIRFKQERRQSSPSFFSFIPKRETDADNKLFFNNTFSDAKPLSV
jgi:hypothetical protein